MWETRRALSQTEVISRTHIALFLQYVRSVFSQDSGRGASGFSLRSVDEREYGITRRRVGRLSMEHIGSLDGGVRVLLFFILLLSFFVHFSGLRDERRGDGVTGSLKILSVSGEHQDFSSSDLTRSYPTKLVSNLVPRG